MTGVLHVTPGKLKKRQRLLYALPETYVIRLRPSCPNRGGRGRTTMIMLEAQVARKIRNAIDTETEVKTEMNGGPEIAFSLRGRSFTPRRDTLDDTTQV